MGRTLNNSSARCLESRRCTCIYVLSRCSACRSPSSSFSRIFIQITYRAAIPSASSLRRFKRATCHSLLFSRPPSMIRVEEVLEDLVKPSAILFHLLDPFKASCFHLVSKRVSIQVTSSPPQTMLHTNSHQPSKSTEIEVRPIFTAHSSLRGTTQTIWTQLASIRYNFSRTVPRVLSRPW